MLEVDVTWEAPGGGDARVEVQETPRPGLQTPDQGGDQEHGAAVI